MSCLSCILSFFANVKSAAQLKFLYQTFPKFVSEETVEQKVDRGVDGAVEKRDHKEQAAVERTLGRVVDVVHPQHQDVGDGLEDQIAEHEDGDGQDLSCDPIRVVMPAVAVAVVVRVLRRVCVVAVR